MTSERNPALDPLDPEEHALVRVPKLRPMWEAYVGSGAPAPYQQVEPTVRDELLSVDRRASFAALGAGVTGLIVAILAIISAPGATAVASMVSAILGGLATHGVAAAVSKRTKKRVLRAGSVEG